MELELLAPAKNLTYGCEAINHGADAVYIGAPAFGARVAATNTLADIEALVRYAHLYRAKVFSTVNTILFDNEIEDAVAMIRQLYNIGVDAIILQDMGLLECDLPPVELHASTQCHNASIERIKFMESVGFRRVILARETSLQQMEAIRQATNIDLEAFVHGALCVSYSGQCYMSHFLNQRSGNRGCCSQPCRSSYDLLNGAGEEILHDRHLLSLRDFNASQHIGSMIAAGISSFKIEGRLKDLSYVKNVTAHYRQLFDTFMGEHTPASAGRVTFYFTPDVEKTFNRGYTDYFLQDRHPMASLATQKSVGKYVGKVSAVGRQTITIESSETFSNGDGLCYFDSEGQLQGFLVNDVHQKTVTPNRMPNIKTGTKLWRNNDQRFEKTLQGHTADRKVGVELLFSATPDGFCLEMKDVDGLSVKQYLTAEHTPSDKPEHAIATIAKQLSKLGNTPFECLDLKDATNGQYFIPASLLNELRRQAIEQLTEHRINRFRPTDTAHIDRHEPYFETELNYSANIVNQKSEDFYKKHGVKSLQRGPEQTGNFDGVALMTTRYCLRYELGCCLKDKNTHQPTVKIRPDETLYLRNLNRKFRLEFDCKNCQMKIFRS